MAITSIQDICETENKHRTQHHDTLLMMIVWGNVNFLIEDVKTCNLRNPEGPMGEDTSVQMLNWNSIKLQQRSQGLKVSLFNQI